jgi:hypothetical protein
MLGGDVHQAYLETVGFRRSADVSTAVYQAVCSPFRNQLGQRERKVLRVARRSRVARWVAPRLARSAGVQSPDIRWRLLQQPTWRNQLGWLIIEKRWMKLTIETTPGAAKPQLETTHHHQLA